MLGTNQRVKKQGFFKGCIVPLLVIVGMVAGCFLFCSGIYYINDLSTRAEASAQAARNSANATATVLSFQATQTAEATPEVSATLEPGVPDVQITTLPEVPPATPVP
jgi:long-subunit fatty acid transport protein